MDGMQIKPASFRRFRSASLGASAKEATFTPSFTMSSARSKTSGASERRFTPKGLSVRSFTRAMASASSSKSRVADAMMPSPPALAVPAVRRALATQPMPVCTMGYSTPTRSQSAVRSAGCAMSVFLPRWRART